MAHAHRSAKTGPEESLQMRAVAQRKYGNSSVLSIENLQRPTPAADEVLIEVHAAGLDRGTEHLMTGNPYLIRILGYGFTKPKNPVLGLDVAGTVVSVGAEVTRFVIGDEVFGIAAGSFAEYAVAKETKLARKPTNVSFNEAAVSAVSGITALQALTDIGRVEPGHRVLVIGASGGVGTFAVQIAKARGALVDGVAGTDNLELVRSLGATEVFDHRTSSLADIEHRYDLVIDIGGRNSVHNLRRVLAKSGTLVIVGGENGNRLTGGIGRQIFASLLSPFTKQRLLMFMSKEEHSFMDRLGEYLETGQVRPVIGGHFPLSQAREAMALLESGRASGKTLIEAKGA